jgi:hypothetical protein
MIQERYLKRSQQETCAPFGAGFFNEGNVLIVGEQDSDPTTSEKQRPFCTNKGCTGWLNKQLDAANIPEERLFWVNALHNDGSQSDLDQLVSLLKPSAILAMGGIAQAVCKKQGLDFTPFYHPQYWKRFKSKHPYALIDKLSELT